MIIEGIANEELGDKLEWEGLEYFFLDYLNPSEINDAELKDAAERFDTALHDIVNRLRDLGVEIYR